MDKYLVIGLVVVVSMALGFCAGESYFGDNKSSVTTVRFGVTVGVAPTASAEVAASAEPVDAGVFPDTTESFAGALGWYAPNQYLAGVGGSSGAGSDF